MAIFRNYWRLIPVLTGNRYYQKLALSLVTVNPRAYGEQAKEQGMDNPADG